MPESETRAGLGRAVVGELADRRRPDRPAEVAADLIPLLRDAANVPIPDVPVAQDDPDQLRAFRGIMIGAALGLVLWAALIGLIRYAFW